jgi:CheY-like chemotaxis protein
MLEDEAPLRLPVVKVLRKKGFHLLEAPDGTEAMAQIEQHHDDIAVLFLDVTVPGVSSREVLAEALRLKPSSKVIVTSAYAEEVAQGSFPGMKIDAFLRKPYQIADLEKLLNTFLPTDATPTIGVGIP